MVYSFLAQCLPAMNYYYLYYLSVLFPGWSCWKWQGKAISFSQITELLECDSRDASGPHISTQRKVGTAETQGEGSGSARPSIPVPQALLLPICELFQCLPITLFFPLK